MNFSEKSWQIKRSMVYPVIILLFLCVFNARAGLNSPVLVNPSFEDPALAAAAQSNDINDWFDAVGYTYTSDDGAVTHPETPYGDNWAELGNERWIYQQIGTYDENMTLDISFLLGQRSDKIFSSIFVSLLVGGTGTPADKDLKYYTENPLQTQVGATIITTSAQIAPFPAAGIATSPQTVQLSTGSGYTVGDPLWLQFNKDGVTARALIDNVIVTLATNDPIATTPTPGSSSTTVDPAAELSWDVANSASPAFDINIGTTPACDEILSAYNTGRTQNYTPSAGLLDYATQYYWRVDVTDGGTEYAGPVWIFTTGGKAANPVPSDGSPADREIAALSWSSDPLAASYDVWFGNPGNLQLVGNYSATSVSFADLAASVGQSALEAGDYQWSVDTKDASGALMVAGDIWNVTIPEVAPVYLEDFTSYDDNAELLAAWTDGIGNGTGSAIALNDMHGAMELSYDNSATPWMSEAKLPLAFYPDWSGADHSILTLTLRGSVDNSDEPIYILIRDGISTATIIYDGPNTTATDQWWQWDISLSDIVDQGVNLSALAKLLIGVGDGVNAGSAGTILVDDIMLKAAKCQAGAVAGDLNGDCRVDMSDLLVITDQWLSSDYLVTALAPNGDSLTASYQFEETSGTVTSDSSGNINNATVEPGTASIYWDADGHASNGSIRISEDLKVLLPASVFTSVNDDVTVSVWLKTADAILEQVQLSAGQIGETDIDWDISDWDALQGQIDPGQWNHFAVTLDGSSDEICIYHNGVLVARDSSVAVTVDGIVAGISTLELDSTAGQVLVDDLRVYNASLTQQEVVYLAVGVSGQVLQPIAPILTNADIYADGRIDLQDMAILAQGWLAD